MRKYQPQEIEPRWQKEWTEDRLYWTNLTKPNNKYYVLVELPYTSGDLHMGHWFTFTYGDVTARFKRMQGYNVIFPNGFDTFGLPAENAAIKNKMHPKEWTYQNIDRMKEQFGTMGTAVDWEKTAITCDPDYYKWNQWIFLKMFERGIAYRGKAISNWCPSCQTVLADENVEVGLCWRCQSEIERKEIDQWFFKITAYADQLIWPETPEVDWPKALRDAQNKWIGKSEGVIIKFGEMEVFTTRPDTVYGATFLVISPDHPALFDLVTADNKQEVEEYVTRAKQKNEQERKENKEKSGVFLGSFVKNPFTKEDIPVWVAEYVLMGYGTGAIMAVPAHDQRDFEFAKKHNLEISWVIEPDADLDRDQAYEGEGKLVNSGEYNGLDSAQAREKISDYIVKKNLGSRETNYHLHDWSISRQRYWGTPIPIVYCDSCGTVPVPDGDLPVVLPEQVDYAPKGKAPLATAEDWVNTKCPQCGKQAKREVETMDGFVDNSWYFYRYLDPNNDQEIFDQGIVGNWMPVDIYIGGAEHTYGHALYSRFFNYFFKDLGLVKFNEYTKRRLHHGVILGPDGYRMSKSRGNVVNPDEQVVQYGADTVRTYLVFLGPYDIVTAWNPNGINGVYHFLQRVWALVDKVTQSNDQDELSKQDLYQLNKTIKKVTTDIKEIKFNTAVAALMEWLNYLSKKERVAQEEYKTFLKLLAPFAPHITEEIWQMVSSELDIVNRKSEEHDKRQTTNDKSNWSIHQQPWPEVEERYLQEEQVTVVVQVNGRVRETLLIQKELAGDKSQMEKQALASPKVQKFLDGKTPVKTVYVPGKILNLVI